ncbi:hypothetical protein CNQ87_10635 [Lysinibacillus fusiformis]|uniref:hypothetical protein n=1 Tax=Lysinibacillus fusiformis TaxID=28031 RepID=UPI000BBA4346|nr:hypothetical protein [Lysinibacillus fusiformis]PCD84789.1 hypothetical protein CNQ87_10635 [Lysinibacillus fusiformis]
MSKNENILVKVLIALAGLTIGVVVVLTIIAFQIGVDELEKPNRIAIISGLLSMVGGIAGAFGAYLIARMQMTKQLDLQYKKEEEKMIKEIKINNYLKVLEIGDALLQSLIKLNRLLVESTVEINRDNDSFIEQEKIIRVQLQEVKEQTSKLIIYKGFYEENQLFHFENITKDITSMEEQVLRKLIEFYKKFDINKTLDKEGFNKIYDQISNDFKNIINSPKHFTLILLTITQFNIEKAIKQNDSI